MAAAAMTAAFAFILTRGAPAAPDNSALGVAPEDTPTTSATPSAHPSVATKADRKPPASRSAGKPTTTSAAPVNTGPESPGFKAGQWIVVLEKYTADGGLDAGRLAKDTATKINRSGVPAKAMLVNGQYPGFANSSGEPVLNTWVVYLGPGPSSAEMLNFCAAPRTQRAYRSPACPTYEPAG
ncbi:hypothetical protein GCM10009534_26350 [Kribbella sandramycini]